MLKNGLSTWTSSEMGQLNGFMSPNKYTDYDVFI